MDRRRAETAPRRPAAFHCGWLLDGGGAGPRRDVVLTVAGGRIDAIFPAAEGCQGLKPVDWRAFTVLPPLVDAHVHLFLSGCDSIEHGFFMGEANMERMAARGTVWVPTAGTIADPACCNRGLGRISSRWRGPPRPCGEAWNKSRPCIARDWRWI